MTYLSAFSFFFFFNDTATTEIYTLSLHDALPIYVRLAWRPFKDFEVAIVGQNLMDDRHPEFQRSEEHTSELQSPCNLVCRLLLEKKKIEQVVSGALTHRVGAVQRAHCLHGTRYLC